MFQLHFDKTNHTTWLETDLTGKALLTNPQLNKDTAFTQQERELFNLEGKLPPLIETLEEQVTRTYQQYQSFNSDLRKGIFLRSLHDRNQTLFYRLLDTHLEDMIPIIYTPLVGTAAQTFSQEYRQPRGLYIPHTATEAEIETILNNRTNPDIDLVVATDGEGVLGIGDQGIGGMDVIIAKLMLHTVCAGISPLRTLPIMLDAGTNNPALLNDPLYLGLHEPRIEGDAYHAFIQRFMSAIQHQLPRAFLHWEDFGRQNANHILATYRHRHPSFNDDIQGTGLVALACLLAAFKADKTSWHDQRIVVFGAGSAGMGITETIANAMRQEGLSESDIIQRFYLVDRQGLLLKSMDNLTDAQRPYARADEEVADYKRPFQSDVIDLTETIQQVKPTILIGSSAQPASFTRDAILTMSAHTKHPIILPLSNPTEKAEATPDNLLNWTHGQGRIAMGSPFEPVYSHQKRVTIAQCNNALAFPGIALGMIISGAKVLTDKMLFVGAQALADQAPILQDPEGAILPPIQEAKTVAHQIAKAIALHAIEAGTSSMSPGQIDEAIENYRWNPEYYPYILSSSRHIEGFEHHRE